MRIKLNHYFLLILLLSSAVLKAQDTVWVQTLSFEDITKRKGSWQFPEEGKSWEKILMYYTLKCDPRTTRDQFACGEWDYLTYNILYDTVGKIDTNWVVNQYEIGRFITPYGIGLDLGPEGFRWIYDVTDYAPVLHDLVTLSAGNTQELIDLKFAFIPGTPPRPVKKVHFIRNKESRQYKFVADDTHFKADTVKLMPETKGYKLITRITGHGHNGTYDPASNKIHCCEWANKKHNIAIDGVQRLEWDIWQNDECALNPIIDQGGNWAPPRAGWCPGAPVPDYNFDLTPWLNGKQEAVIDYGVEAVPADNTGQGNGNYVVSLHLIEYGDISFRYDAEVEDILAPSNWELHKRINPTCAQPKIKIRNKGSEALTECTLWYGVKGGNQIRFTWRGNLAFMESEVVDLPFKIWDWEGMETDPVFTARVERPNGQLDENTQNDELQSRFAIPKTLPGKVGIWWRNNNLAGDVELRITDENGNTVYEKSNLAGGELFNDELNLNPGCYKLSVNTREGFGLAYPLIPQVGTGFLRFRQPNGPVLELLNPDFGKSIEYYFTSSYSLNTDEVTHETPAFRAWPNPARDELSLEIENLQGVQLELIATDLQGREIHRQQFTGATPYDQKTIDTRSWNAGLYLIHLKGKGIYRSLKLSVQ